MDEETTNMNRNAQEYLNSRYLTLQQRNEEKELDLSGWDEESWIAKNNWTKLTGDLDLSEFPNLEKLNCSYNEITALNLTNCSRLIELKCWGNEITEINFPNYLKLETLQAWTNNLTEIDWNAFNSKTLTYISISNNNLGDQSIEIIARFSNLKELYLGTDDIKRLEKGEYNGFSGPLRNLLSKCPKLTRLQIEGTGIENDFKKIPKYLKIVGWHEQNDTIARIIPLERLYVIRGNIKQFVKKWGKRQESVPSELSNLQSPEELGKLRWSIYGMQALGRGAAITGAVLTFQDQSAIGGGILGIYPLTELVVSKLDEKLKYKQSKWNEFLVDADLFLDNLNELKGILIQFEFGMQRKWGNVFESAENLFESINNFCKTYDGTNNGEFDGEVDIYELILNRKTFVDDLDGMNSSMVQKIIDNIGKLEEIIVKYRKMSLEKFNSNNKGRNENINVNSENGKSTGVNNCQLLKSLIISDNDSSSMSIEMPLLSSS